MGKGNDTVDLHPAVLASSQIRAKKLHNSTAASTLPSSSLAELGTLTGNIVTSVTAGQVSQISELTMPAALQSQFAWALLHKQPKKQHTHTPPPRRPFVPPPRHRLHPQHQPPPMKHLPQNVENASTMRQESLQQHQQQQSVMVGSERVVVRPPPPPFLPSGMVGGSNASDMGETVSHKSTYSA